MEVIGILKVKYDIQNVSDRFQKRDFILTITELENNSSPEYVQFQLQQEKCALLNDLIVGQKISVHFNIRGCQWNGPQGFKYFNTLEAWSVKAVDK